MKRVIRKQSGTMDPQITQRELDHAAIARKAATTGMVLLKNSGILPLAKDKKVALLGGAAVRTFKGGTGSGDVNCRHTVSVYEGLEAAGYVLTDKEWLDGYEAIYSKAREDWKAKVWQTSEENGRGIFFAYAENPFKIPAGMPLVPAYYEDADAVIYVIGRVAGEQFDRAEEKGDYLLSETEEAELTELAKAGKKIIVLLNCGAQIDMKFIESVPQIEAVMLIGQPGQEAGHAVADVLSGAVTPSGKLTDTWAVSYSDIPGYDKFSTSTETEKYIEGIYVGYRYFDAFDVPVQYPFGFGLSYTDFEITPEGFTSCDGIVEVAVSVKNTGSVYSGQEVVQIYAALPQSGQEKELKRLVAFGKTKLLAPGEADTLKMTFASKDIAVFNEEKSAWIVEAGRYGILAGNCSCDEALTVMGSIAVAEDTVIEEVQHICPLKEDLQEISRPQDVADAYVQGWMMEAETLPCLAFAPQKVVVARYPEDDADRQAKEIVAKLTEDEKIQICVGQVGKGLSANSNDDIMGGAGIKVPGSAGETSGVLDEKYDISPVSLSDGPAGVRILKKYDVSRVTGRPFDEGILGAMEGGFLLKNKPRENVDVYYQFTTGIPTGSLLAMSWDPAVLEEVGAMVARELCEYGITYWLAPGMNIHRNPLCGRNFEYYSEDPLVTGKMAAGMTKGVQTGGAGCGTTIKHFACNNAEDARMSLDSVLSERALREIYLRGFEIAVKESQPMAIMTSYNLINGEHTANSKDLCTVAARDEWGFKGIIMTDWTTTGAMGGSISWKCIDAGNDLIMPGYVADLENIKAGLDSGELSMEALETCARRNIAMVLRSLEYEGARPYGELMK